MTQAASTYRSRMSWDPVKLNKRLQGLGVPRKLRDSIVVAAKHLSVPGEQEHRKTGLSATDAPGDVDVRRFVADGYVHLPDSLDHMAQLAADDLDDYFAASTKSTSHGAGRKEQFLRALAVNGELLCRAPVRDFVLGERVLSLATHYFGEVPVLSDVRLWWSPPNDSCVESQQYHFDGEDRTQLKLFLNVRDVDEDNGPLTVIDAASSAMIARQRRRSARLEDITVEDTVGPQSIMTLKGPKGSFGLVDTSRCLHYGSRRNLKDRVVLMAQYTRFMAPKASMPAWLDELGAETIAGLDATQRRVLNIA